jgi:hypothetical protein
MRTFALLFFSLLPISMRTISFLLGAFGCISYAQTVNPSIHPPYTRNPSATKPISIPSTRFVLWVNPEHWRETKRRDNPLLGGGTVDLAATNGQAQAYFVADATPESKNTVPRQALFPLDAKTKAGSNGLISDEKLIVNGHEFSCLTFESITNGHSDIGYGCTYSGSAGLVALLSVCAKETFDVNQAAFKELLGGMEISDEVLPAHPSSKITDNLGPQVLTLNNGKIKLTYDGRKWTRVADDEKGRIWFEDHLGNASAFIVLDLSQRSTDEVANLRVANSNQPKVLLRERRTITGTEVCFMILSNQASEKEFTSYGYYYGGKAGSFELVVTTSSDKIGERAKDFIELLNGLQIVE